MVLARAPAAPGRAVVLVAVQSRVAASQQNAASSRAQAIATTPAGLRRWPAQELPALVQPALGAPGDLDHPRVLAVLAASQAVADGGPVAVVVGGLDQQPAGVDRVRPW